MAAASRPRRNSQTGRPPPNSAGPGWTVTDWAGPAPLSPRRTEPSPSLWFARVAKNCRSRGFLLRRCRRGRAHVAGGGCQINLYVNCTKMDSEVQRDGRILDLIDDAWREDKLPYEDVAIPLNELPEPEQDNGGTTESVKEQEMKWTDLALQYLHENVPPTGN
uniref:Anaphase-promoting complex subunit 13 n=1 Tax=Pelusios castaneus TaxID=367368 RepID=A0A8C8VMZ7_9SAUR